MNKKKRYEILGYKSESEYLKSVKYPQEVIELCEPIKPLELRYYRKNKIAQTKEENKNRSERRKKYKLGYGEPNFMLKYKGAFGGVN